MASCGFGSRSRATDSRGRGPRSRPCSPVGRHASNSSFDAALRREQRPQERLPELARLEREVTLAASSSFDRHYRLRPIAREIAGGLLAARRGVVLDQEPERSRALLGEETWSLVRPDLEPPHDRYGPGIQAAELGRVLAALEAL